MHALIEWVNDNLGIKSFYAAITVGLLLFGILLFIYPTAIIMGLQFLIAIAPIWLPFFVLRIGWHLWMNYTRSRYISTLRWTLLEIKLPREVTKSPKAMEAVIEGFHLGPGESTWINRYLEGRVRPWWSLELVSTEGKIHFYIRTQAFFAPRIKSQIFAQYPEVEIVEVEDYTCSIEFDTSVWSSWGCDFRLSAKGGNALPLRSYVDYGLDKDPKEEHKVDPLAHLLEVFGAIGPGEHMWMQILLRQNRDELHVPGTLAEKQGIRDKAKELIEKMKKEATPTVDGKSTGYVSFTPGQTEIVKAIERKMEKHLFDAGIRFIYLAEKSRFSPVHIFAGANAFKQFSSPTLNSLSPTRGDAEFNYSWQDWFGYHDFVKREHFDSYIRRAFFHYPYKREPSILSTEELATIYHLPSATIQTPTVERIPSRRGEAPFNLPV